MQKPSIYAGFRGFQKGSILSSPVTKALKANAFRAFSTYPWFFRIFFTINHDDITAGTMLCQLLPFPASSRFRIHHISHSDLIKQCRRKDCHRNPEMLRQAVNANCRNRKQYHRSPSHDRSKFPEKFSVYLLFASLHPLLFFTFFPRKCNRQPF